MSLPAFLCMAIAFCAGVVLVGVVLGVPERGRGMRAAVPEPSPSISWPCAVDASATDLNPQERVAVIESLAVVADGWSLSVLAHAAREERDVEVQGALLKAFGALSDP